MIEFLIKLFKLFVKKNYDYFTILKEYFNLLLMFYLIFYYIYNKINLSKFFKQKNNEILYLVFPNILTVILFIIYKQANKII